MATSSSADSGSSADSTTDRRERVDSTDSGATDGVSADDANRDANGETRSNSAAESSDSAALFDRLETAARAVWVAFLAFVVVLALIPAVALWFGAVPFDPPPRTPYFALLAATFVGAAALIAGAIYDV
ncbi:hypothetical protein [Halorussus litoreus]|uniref:hypothetical protein n=1 Tax=Halorussus litoreus TaxID=1710536 RepID=UPI0013004F2F|nr:hypothetical protein [Halorussus litoreus]